MTCHSLMELWRDQVTHALTLVPTHHLLLDQPTGSALTTVEAMAASTAAHTLVLTTSMVPEYLDDLWDRGVALLAVGVTDDATLALLLQEVQQGRRVRWRAPGSGLTSAERKVLTLVARGQSNKRIAQTLKLSERTIENTLTRVFEKRRLSGRTEAALYYWGIPTVDPGGFPLSRP